MGLFHDKKKKANPADGLLAELQLFQPVYDQGYADALFVAGIVGADADLFAAGYRQGSADAQTLMDHHKAVV